MTLIRRSDPTLLRYGVAIALRSIAAIADGRTDPDDALDWNLRVGYLRHVDRDTLILTPDGERAVWLYWQTMRERRGFGNRETISLPAGVNVAPTIEDAAAAAALIDGENDDLDATVAAAAILTGQADMDDLADGSTFLDNLEAA